VLHHLRLVRQEKYPLTKTAPQLSLEEQWSNYIEGFCVKI